MTLGWCAYYLGAWLRSLLSLRALSAVLSSFGALWLFARMAVFFFASTAIPDKIRNAWPWFGALGLIIAAYMCRPHLKVSHKLNGRDVTIEIAVGNVFKFPGAIIIGSNTTFTTHISRDLICKES